MSLPLSAITASTLIAGPAIQRGTQAFADAAASFADDLQNLLSKKQPAEPQATATPSAGQISLETIRSALQENLSALERRLSDELAQRGLHTSLSFRIEADGRGGVHVTGHRHAEEIERVINGSDELRAAFNYLDATHGLIAAAERHQDQLLGNAPPYGSASTLSPTAVERFSLKVNGDEIEISPLSTVGRSG